MVRRLKPYGEAAYASVPDNTGPVDTSLGWHGGDNKITDGGLVHMGARPYSPTHGRFLAVDPIEGGCANDYTYVHGDPINASDVSGTQEIITTPSGLPGLNICRNRFMRNALDLLGFFGKSDYSMLENISFKTTTTGLRNDGSGNHIEPRLPTGRLIDPIDPQDCIPLDAADVERQLIAGIRIAGVLLVVLPICLAIAIASGSSLALVAWGVVFLVFLGILVRLRRVRSRLDRARQACDG